MTPEYASPEQVRGEPIDDGHRRLLAGLLLYELLTGRRPYEFSRHKTAEVVRVICDQPPRRPSTIVLEPARIRRDDETVDVRSAETLAEPRGVDPQKLQRLLVGDLEQIILMALRKEPQRRYATVEVLVQDLDLFEQGRTVTARPLGRLERAGRWVRRNRTVAALATAVALALIGGTVVSTYFAIDARRQADVALSREKDATAARRQAERGARTPTIAAKRPNDCGTSESPPGRHGESHAAAQRVRAGRSRTGWPDLYGGPGVDRAEIAGQGGRVRAVNPSDRPLHDWACAVEPRTVSRGRRPARKGLSNHPTGTGPRRREHPRGDE